MGLGNLAEGNEAHSEEGSEAANLRQLLLVGDGQWVSKDADSDVGSTQAMAVATIDVTWLTSLK